MTFHQATLYTGIVLIVLGLAFCWNGEPVKRALIQFGRSKTATFLVFGASTAWFIYKVAHLSEADEIGIISREFMLIVFIGVALLSFIYVPDFLSVRGLAILFLLVASELLEASWMQYSMMQHMLNIFVYVLMIAVALYMGAVPYKWRDFFTWLFTKAKRARLVGCAFLAYGLALAAMALS